MIPSLPEAISATHVEYLPLATVHLKPLVDISRNCDRQPSVNTGVHGQKTITKEELARIRALCAIQRFIPLNLSAVPRSQNVDMFQGKDLYYAPHVKIPAAESLENSGAN